MDKKLKILVHLHLYYADQTEYFIDKLKNINGADWDLMVTYSNQDEEAMNKLRGFKKETKFLEVENVGYDVWPFIKVIQSSDLDNYDYIIKLHTKREIDKLKINKLNLRSYEWRNRLVDSLLHNPTHFQNLLKKLDKDPRLGMVSSIVTLSKNAWDIYERRLQHEFGRMQLKLHKGMSNMGTMFMARSEIFQPLKQDWLNAEYFNDHPIHSGNNFTRSHIYERVLSLLPISQGFRHKGVSNIKGEALRITMARILQYPFEWTFCLFRKGEHHRKALRLFGIEFYIGKPQCIKFSDSQSYENE